MATFFVRSRGRVSGPFDLEMLQRMVRRAQLSRLHEISSDRVTWTSAGEFEDLFPDRAPISREPVARLEAPPAAEAPPSAAGPTAAAPGAKPEAVVKEEEALQAGLDVEGNSHAFDRVPQVGVHRGLWVVLGGAIFLALVIIAIAVWIREKRIEAESQPTTRVGWRIPDTRSTAC